MWYSKSSHYTGLRWGNAFATEEEQYQLWVEHFKEVLNCTNPLSSDPTATAEDININTSPSTLDEVQKVIKSTSSVQNI
jgi:hypothetical protein